MALYFNNGLLYSGFLEIPKHMRPNIVKLLLLTNTTIQVVLHLKLWVVPLWVQTPSSLLVMQMKRQRNSSQQKKIHTHKSGQIKNRSPTIKALFVILPVVSKKRTPKWTCSKLEKQLNSKLVLNPSQMSMKLRSPIQIQPQTSIFLSLIIKLYILYSELHLLL